MSVDAERKLLIMLRLQNAEVKTWNIYFSKPLLEVILSVSKAI